jgi:hypothetical protein
MESSNLSQQLELIHKKFLRQCLGVRRSVPDVALMLELNRVPLWIDILRQAVRFWNRIQGRADDDIVKMAMHESHQLAELDRDLKC